MTPLHQGYFCLIQYRPVPEREEGLNVGIFVCTQHGACTVLLLQDLALARVLERLGIGREAPWVDDELRSLCQRLRSLAPEDLNERGLRHFGACEAGRVLLLAPHSTAFQDLETEAQELFDRLVMPRF